MVQIIRTSFQKRSKRTTFETTPCTRQLLWPHGELLRRTGSLRRGRKLSLVQRERSFFDLNTLLANKNVIVWWPKYRYSQSELMMLERQLSLYTEGRKVYRSDIAEHKSLHVLFWQSLWRPTGFQVLDLFWQLLISHVGHSLATMVDI